LWSLLRSAREFRPHIVYGYMFAADLVAMLAARHCGARLVWGLRSSALDFRHYDFMSRALQWASRRCAGHADLVIANSAAGLRDYENGGARPRRARVIHNGIDCERFRPDAAARASLRGEWLVDPDDLAIGLVARIDPMKGYEVFLRAAREFLAREPRAVFICAGSATAQNSAHAEMLRCLAAELGIEDRVRWIGHVDRPERVFAALDISTSASLFGEGFSNSVGEAMACGTPCVVTRVGDSAEIVGELGVVVPTHDPVALAEAWRQVCADRTRYSPQAMRERMKSDFSLTRYVQATEQALLDTLGDPPAGVQL
jgi:glycosyltransferase involved in cell wall biosynthesis